MTFSRILICGVARNADSDLHSGLWTIQKLSDMATTSWNVIVTNDNVDGTSQVLENWAESGLNRTLINLDGLADAIPDRIERLATARNAYLLHLRAHLPKPDLVIVMDLDGPNNNLSPDDVIRAINAAPDDWGAIFANQANAYYDLYALRRKGWVEGDVWQEVDRNLNWLRHPLARLANRMLGRRLAPWVTKRVVDEHVRSRQFKIMPDMPFLNVESAFGGLGIYRSEAIAGAWYGARDRCGHTICEHVVFNRQVAENGYCLYICPSLINESPVEHLGTSSGSRMPKDLLS